MVARICEDADRDLICLAVLSKAQATASRNGERQWEAELLRLKGEMLLLPPLRQEADAEAFFRAAIELARRQAARSLELRATMSLARLLTRHGRRGSAQRMLSEAYGCFIEGFDTADLRAAAVELEGLAASQEAEQ